MNLKPGDVVLIRGRSLQSADREARFFRAEIIRENRVNLLVADGEGNQWEFRRNGDAWEHIGNPNETWFWASLLPWNPETWRMQKEQFERRKMVAEIADSNLAILPADALHRINATINHELNMIKGKYRVGL